MEKEVDTIQTPFFSICIPVYNVEKYLDECIKSVLNQNETDYEIILIDDGSKDHSADICDRYSAEYPYVQVVHKENQGLFLARYDAVSVARGKYLLFLDSDDWFMPDALSKIRECIENSHADLVIFDWYKIYSDGRKEITTEPYENGRVFEGSYKNELYCDLIMKSSLNSMCRKCIRRNLYQLDSKNKDYIGLNQAEDKFATMPCVDNAKRVIYLKEPLYGYRMNDQSISHNVTIRNYKNIQLVHERMDKYIKKWNLPERAVAYQSKKRLEFGVICIESMVARSVVGLASKEDVLNAIAYIGKDIQYKKAYERAGSKLSTYKRWICNMVVRNKLKSVYNMCRLIYRLKLIYHKKGVLK